MVKNFIQYFNESIGIPQLLPSSKFEDVKNLETIKVYRSSARPSKESYTSGSHAGTLQQALIRADLMVNDNQKYSEYYLYELVVKLGRVHPDLGNDDGTSHGYSHSLDLASEYDTIIYKNSGEGSINNENLSIIILNPSNVISSKMEKILTSDYLTSIQNDLY